MNERIRQLAEQAEIKGFAYNQDTMMYESVKEFDKEKFAELIVAECIKAVDNSGGDNAEYHMDSIKKHFGVEE